MIKGIVEPGATMMIIGETGIGKTTYALKIATCLILGKHIPGLPFKNKGRAEHVLFLFSEPEVSEKKIRKLLKIFGISKKKSDTWQENDRLHFKVFNTMDDIVNGSTFSEGDNGEAIKANYDYIIIDNLHLTIFNENEVKFVKKVLNDLKQIDGNIKTNPMFIVTHPAKDGRPRGHQAFGEWPRTTLLLKGEVIKKEVEVVPIKATERKSLWTPKSKWTIPEFEKITKKGQYRLTAKDVQNELKDIGSFVTKKNLTELLAKKYKVREKTVQTNIDFAIKTGKVLKHPKKGLRAA